MAGAPKPASTTPTRNTVARRLARRTKRVRGAFTSRTAQRYPRSHPAAKFFETLEAQRNQARGRGAKRELRAPRTLLGGHGCADLGIQKRQRLRHHGLLRIAQRMFDVVAACTIGGQAVEVGAHALGIAELE